MKNMSFPSFNNKHRAGLEFTAVTVELGVEITPSKSLALLPIAPLNPRTPGYSTLSIFLKYFHRRFVGD